MQQSSSPISSFRFWCVLTTTVFMMISFVKGGKVYPCIRRALREEGKVNAFITFDEGVQDCLREAGVGSSSNAQDVYDKLVANAKHSQAKVVKVLESHKVHSISFWITNELAIPDASEALITDLETIPGIHIRKEFTTDATLPNEKVDLHPDYLALVQPDADPSHPMTFIEEQAGAATSSSSSNFATNATSSTARRRLADSFSEHVARKLNEGALPWGLRELRVNDVWTRHNIRGQNIVVGSIDSGVQHNHVELESNFRSSNGWYDPYDQTSRPIDPNGHGTHTLATIVGKNVGIAPKAQWIACRGCNEGRCTQTALLQCAEFMLCPTDASGRNVDCRKAPDVVNNSWGRGRYPGLQARLRDILYAWTTAGIVPVFAVGNDGAACGSADFPGDLPFVLAVGATSRENEIAWFSSRGAPVGSGTTQVKPDVAGPGVDVVSATSGSEDGRGYAQMSGSSMAAPHVAGVVALMLSHEPQLSGEDVRKILEKTSEQSRLNMPLSGCDAGKTKFPNNVFGHGEVDAWNAIVEAKKTKASGRYRMESKIECVYDGFIMFGECQPSLQCSWNYIKFQCTPN